MFLARGYGAKKLNIWVLPFCQADWMNPVSYFPLNTVWLWSTYQSYKIQPMSLPNANVYILVQQGKESNALFLIFLCHVCCHYLLAVCAHHPNLTSLSYFHFCKIHSFIGGFDTNESYKLKPDWESFITSNRHILLLESPCPSVRPSVTEKYHIVYSQCIYDANIIPNVRCGQDDGDDHHSCTMRSSWWWRSS